MTILSPLFRLWYAAEIKQYEYISFIGMLELEKMKWEHKQYTKEDAGKTPTTLSLRTLNAFPLNWRNIKRHNCKRKPTNIFLSVVEERRGKDNR